MNATQRILDEENRREGRVIPNWRIWFLVMVGVAAMTTGALLELLHAPTWAWGIAGFVMSVLITTPLDKFRKRSIS